MKIWFMYDQFVFTESTNFARGLNLIAYTVVPDNQAQHGKFLVAKQSDYQKSPLKRQKKNAKNAKKVITFFQIYKLIVYDLF